MAGGVRSYATNGLAVPTRDAAPPAVKAGWTPHPETVVVVLVLLLSCSISFISFSPQTCISSGSLASGPPYIEATEDPKAQKLDSIKFRQVPQVLPEDFQIHEMDLVEGALCLRRSARTSGQQDAGSLDCFPQDADGCPASSILAGSPAYPDPSVGRRRSVSWGLQTLGCRRDVSLASLRTRPHSPVVTLNTASRCSPCSTTALDAGEHAGSNFRVVHVV